MNTCETMLSLSRPVLIIRSRGRRTRHEGHHSERKSDLLNTTKTMNPITIGIVLTIAFFGVLGMARDLIKTQNRIRNEKRQR